MGIIKLGVNQGKLVGNLTMDNFVTRTKSKDKGNNFPILRATSRSTNFKPKIIPKAKNKINKHKPKMNTIIKYFTKDPSGIRVHSSSPLGHRIQLTKVLGGKLATISQTGSPSVQTKLKSNPG